MTVPGTTDAGRERAFLPVPVAELELSDPGPAPEPNALGQILLLVRMHGSPLGTLSLLEGGGARSPDLRSLAVEALAEPLARHLADDSAHDAAAGAGVGTGARCPAAPRPSASGVTVVVCTIGEDPRLVQTVRSLLDQTHERLEVVVVDNRPDTGRVARLLAGLEDPRLRLLTQPRVGLSAARNAGVAAAGHDLVMFTDDDAFADPDWVSSLVQPFDRHPEVVCVTGLVLPAEIATPAQALFEEFGGFDKGFTRKVWVGLDRPGLDLLGERGAGGVLFPFSAGVFGSGNNMAFRVDWLRSHGAFDEALGAGTATRGGEDLDAFLRVMLAGDVLVYEPRAIVRHHARGDMSALRQQMFGYGSGMAAVIAKHLLQSPGRAAQILRRLPAGLGRLLGSGSEKNEARTAGYPRDLVRAELSGYLAGPALYVRGRREASRRLEEHPAAAVSAGSATRGQPAR
jgi:GT2 family glycosyltransferase